MDSPPPLLAHWVTGDRPTLFAALLPHAAKMQWLTSDGLPNVAAASVRRKPHKICLSTQARSCGLRYKPVEVVFSSRQYR